MTFKIQHIFIRFWPSAIDGRVTLSWLSMADLKGWNFSGWKAEILSGRNLEKFGRVTVNWQVKLHIFIVCDCNRVLSKFIFVQFLSRECLFERGAIQKFGICLTSRTYFPSFKELSGQAIRGAIRCPRNLGLSYNCAGGEEDANKSYLVALFGSWALRVCSSDTALWKYVVQSWGVVDCLVNNEAK